MEYVVQRRLGRGGMGVVDLAVDSSGRLVACKRLLLHGSAHEMHKARQRIRREAAALEQLRHPNIVPLLDLVDDGDDVVLVLPYLTGGTLAEQVAHHGTLSPGQLHQIADALFGALAEAHRRGVVHRDIKPANVLFDIEGRPYLTDFGVASLRDATGGLTATGAVIGTPEFMAPEQARGEEVGPAGDVFSLGATLLYGATGHPPYGRGDPAVVVQRAARGRVAPLPADLDRSLRRRLQPTLARTPSRRPSAASAAGDGPRPLKPGVPGQVGPAGTQIGGPRPRSLPRRSIGIAFGAVLAVAAVLTAAALVTRSSDETSAPPDSTTAACVDLPYQPCGQSPAPGTDGERCLVGFHDIDGDATTGCEVQSDQLNGTPFVDPIVANLVPVDAVDRYPFQVDHESNGLVALLTNTFCDNLLQVTLEAPPGVSMRLDVLTNADELLGKAISADGLPATVELPQPGCSPATLDLVAQVSWFGQERSGGEYTLSRKGSW
ncbi:MAG TPA: serine/threonine-protein kinase [Acidimicrobiales bacterium]